MSCDENAVTGQFEISSAVSISESIARIGTVDYLVILRANSVAHRLDLRVTILKLTVPVYSGEMGQNSNNIPMVGKRNVCHSVDDGICR
jgi:hypothetical protein